MGKVDASHVRKLELSLLKGKAIHDATRIELQLRGLLTELLRHFWSRLFKQIKGKLGYILSKLTIVVTMTCNYCFAVKDSTVATFFTVDPVVRYM